MAKRPNAERQAWGKRRYCSGIEKVCFAPIVLKNSKIAGLRKSRHVACGRIQPRQGSVKSIRAPASVFAVIDVVPRIEASEAHQGL